MTREEMHKVKAGDLLTTKYGNIILVERVEFGENAVCVYDYFDYDKEIGMQMNEWLGGFYGPKFDKYFYRHSTDEERRLFFTELEKYGYMMTERYGKAVPTQTPKEYHRHHCKKEPQGLDEAAEEWVDENCFDCDIIGEGRSRDAFKAGAEWMAEQGETHNGIVYAFNGDSNTRFVSGNFLSQENFNLGDNVIVQIRKKEV